MNDSSTLSAEWTLFGMGSPNVRKITIMLEEAGLDYDFRHVNVFRSEQAGPEFLGLNPNGKVPVLVHRRDGLAEPLVIFESLAILIYLAERAGILLPTEEPARSTVLQWLMIQGCNVGPMLGQLNHFTFAAPEGHDYSRDRYRREARRLYRLVDRRLAHQRWLGGEDYSIADVATYPWMLYLERHGFDAVDFPHLSSWRDEISARPAVQQGLARIQTIEPRDAEAMRTAAPEHLDRFFGRIED